MKIVAIMAVRNEQEYLANALRSLIENGIYFGLLDNGSTDITREIGLRDEFQSHLVALREISFDGSFDLTRQLNEKMNLIHSIEADWVIHLDADEILHSYRDGETLSEAIGRIDAAGFTAIDFNEFVFLPLHSAYRPDYAGHQPILSYYFFEPDAPRLMRAWKKSSGATLVGGGGHRLSDREIRLAPEKMAMRHYIFRDQDHAYRKYAERIFAPGECARGWHANRVAQPVHRFRFPPAGQLSWLAHPGSRDLDRSRPRIHHYWQW
jgi:glycosyltransferase involved in cell wall biosynthesis